jgi:hypothetical protein
MIASRFPWGALRSRGGRIPAREWRVCGKHLLILGEASKRNPGFCLGCVAYVRVLTFIVSLCFELIAGSFCRTRWSVPSAGVAQLVEHLICNQRVGGSNPFASSTRLVIRQTGSMQ